MSLPNLSALTHDETPTAGWDDLWGWWRKKAKKEEPSHLDKLPDELIKKMTLADVDWSTMDGTLYDKCMYLLHVQANQAAASRVSKQFRNAHDFDESREGREMLKAEKLIRDVFAQNRGMVKTLHGFSLVFNELREHYDDDLTLGWRHNLGRSSNARRRSAIGAPRRRPCRRRRCDLPPSAGDRRS